MTSRRIAGSLLLHLARIAAREGFRLQGSKLADVLWVLDIDIQPAAPDSGVLYSDVSAIASLPPASWTGKGGSS